MQVLQLAVGVVGAAGGSMAAGGPGCCGVGHGTLSEGPVQQSRVGVAVQNH